MGPNCCCCSATAHPISWQHARLNPWVAVPARPAAQPHPSGSPAAVRYVQCSSGTASVCRAVAVAQPVLQEPAGEQHLSSSSSNHQQPERRSRRLANSSSSNHNSSEHSPAAASQVLAQQVAVQRQAVAVAAAAAVLPPQQLGVPDVTVAQVHQEQQQQQQQQTGLQLPLLPPSLLQLQEQRPASPRRTAGNSGTSSSSGGAVVDPSSLCISDRVRMLASNAAARRRGSKPRAATPSGPPVNVLQYCSGAGLSGAAGGLVLKHVKATRISSTPDVLGPFVASYRRLAQVYGEPVVVEWLRKAPPVIRMEESVPSRLAQLLLYLGPSATMSDVLALTKRCPQVLQVSRAILQERMEQLCSLLNRDPHTQAGVLLVAAPALLAMQSHTLELKLQQLQALAGTHASWVEAYRACPSKSLAVLLTYSLERQLRLHYAAAHGLQEKLQMNTVMAWSKRDWLEAHPDFEDWCHSYKRQQQQQQLALQEAQQQQQQTQQQQQEASEELAAADAGAAEPPSLAVA